MDENMDADLGRSLGQIEGKVDAILSALRDMDRRADALELRVRANENWRSKAAGVAAATSAVMATAVTFLLRFVGG